jgi:hypothetical protein
MSLIVASIGFDLLSACFIKLLIDENNRIEEEKLGDIGGTIKVKSEHDILEIPENGSAIIRVRRNNRSPIVYKQIHCKIDYKDQLSNKIAYYHPTDYDYDHFVNLRFNMYTKRFGSYLVEPSQGCEIICEGCDQNYSIISGLQLFKYLASACNQNDNSMYPLYKTISLNGTYIIKDDIIDNTYLYMNTKINKKDKTVDYDIIGSNPELVVKRKYEGRENFIMHAGILIAFAAIATTVFSVVKTLRS